MSQVCVYAYSDASGVRKYVDETDFNFTGTWSAFGSYIAEQDVAVYSDTQYIAIITNVGANPRATVTRTRPAKWSPLALLYEYQCDNGPGTEVIDVTARAEAQEALALAQTGTSVANSAYVLAQIGTNTGTAALQAAAIAQATANAAFSIAVDGTNAAASAQSTADAAWTLAQIGTNTGTAAYDYAASAYHLAQIGTNTGTAALNAAATAKSTADSAYVLAQIGTNTGTAAYDLASSGSSVAWQAYQIATAGTHGGQVALMVMCSAFTPATTGPDSGQVVVPYEFDGSQSIAWTVRRATLRVADAGSAVSVAIEKSTGPGVFSGTQLTVLALGSNTYETANAGIFGTVSSGDKMRMNILDMGSAQNWFVSVQLYHPYP